MILPPSLAKLVQTVDSIEIVVDNAIRPCRSFTESAPVVRRRRSSPGFRKKRSVPSNSSVTRWDSVPPLSSPTGTVVPRKKTVGPLHQALNTLKPVRSPDLDLSVFNLKLLPDKLTKGDGNDSDSDDSFADEATMSWFMEEEAAPSTTLRSPAPVSTPLPPPPPPTGFNRWDSSPSITKKEHKLPRSAPPSTLLSLKACAVKAASMKVPVRRLDKPLQRPKSRSNPLLAPPKKPVRKGSSDDDVYTTTADTADLLDQALRITGGEDFEVTANNFLLRQAKPLPEVPFRY